MSYWDCSYNLPQLSLGERVKMGPDWCTYEEWEAYCWFCQRWNSHIMYRDGTCMSFIELMMRESSFAGTITIEVPTAGNPNRPQIVNQLMYYFGAKLLECYAQDQVTLEGTKRIAIDLTYKTMEIGLINEFTQYI